MVKNLPANVGDRFDPGSGRSPGEGNDYSLQYSCLENSTDRGAWRATIYGVSVSDMTEQLTLSHLLKNLEGRWLDSFFKVVYSTYFYCMYFAKWRQSYLEQKAKLSCLIPMSTGYLELRPYKTSFHAFSFSSTHLPHTNLAANLSSSGSSTKSPICQAFLKF